MGKATERFVGSDDDVLFDETEDDKASETEKLDAYNPDQPRAENGQWGEGGGSASATPKAGSHEKFTNPSARDAHSSHASTVRAKASDRLKSQVTPEENQAISRFTSGDFRDLRDGTTEQDRADRQAIHSAMAKAEAQAVEKTDLYRGLVVSDSAAQYLNSKDAVKLGDLTSWSTHPWVAADFADKETKGAKTNRVVLQVHTKRGLPVSSFSRFAEEEETIMPAQSYRITSREAITLPNGDHYATLIKLEES